MAPFDVSADPVVDLQFTHGWRRSRDGVTWLFLLAEEAGRPVGFLTASIRQGAARIDPPSVEDAEREAELGEQLVARARALIAARAVPTFPA